MQSKRPALFTSSRHTPLPTGALLRSGHGQCHVIRAWARLEQGSRLDHPARARKAASDSLGLRIGRMHASSTCRRLKMASQRPFDGRSGEAW